MKDKFSANSGARSRLGLRSSPEMVLSLQLESAPGPELEQGVGLGLGLELVQWLDLGLGRGLLLEPLVGITTVLGVKFQARIMASFRARIRVTAIVKTRFYSMTRAWLTLCLGSGLGIV